MKHGKCALLYSETSNRTCALKLQDDDGVQTIKCEPRDEKTGFLHMRIQRRRSANLISAFEFAKRIVQSLYFLNPKFQASSHVL